MVDNTKSSSGLFNKITNLYEKGKQKIKEKLKTTNVGRLGPKDVNIKMSVQRNQSKSTPTKIVSGSGKVDDNFFVIEDEEDGGHIKYVLQDNDSDDEYTCDSDTKKEKVKQNDTEKTQIKDEAPIAETVILEDKQPTKQHDDSKTYNASEDEFYHQENLDDYSICHKVLLKV